MRTRPMPEPGFPHRRQKNLLKRDQCGETIAAAQDEWQFVWLAGETHHAIECDVERRHHDARRCFAYCGDDASRQTHVITVVNQRDVKVLLQNQSASQSVFTVLMMLYLFCARSGVRVWQD